MWLAPGWPDEFVKKPPKMKPNPLFVTINTKILPWGKVPPKLGLLLNFRKKSQRNQSPIRRKFAQSCHPGWHTYPRRQKNCLKKPASTLLLQLAAMHQTTRFLVLALVAACLELILTGTTALPVELCGQRLENRLIRGHPVLPRRVLPAWCLGKLLLRRS
jgi:hypothetical protein